MKHFTLSLALLLAIGSGMQAKAANACDTAKEEENVVVLDGKRLDATTSLPPGVYVLDGQKIVVAKIKK